VERLKEAKEEGDFFSPFTEKFDEVGEVISTGVGAILDRHSSDTDPAAEVGGTTIAWSDFNPFKRRKK
jgi:hypothetical protein